jgi:hypothetical protein
LRGLFSDPVFAIAITLLAVNLHVAKTGNVGSAHELHEAIPAIFGFAISFLAPLPRPPFIWLLIWISGSVINRFWQRK